MASTVLDPPAVQIAAILTALGVTPTVKAYKWAPRELATLPAGVVEIPSFQRTPVDTAEDHLGATDWHIQYPVALYFALHELATDQARAVLVVEAFTLAIDASPGLAGTVQEAKVTSAIPTILDEDTRNRALLVYETTVDCLKFV